MTIFRETCFNGLQALDQLRIGFPQEPIFFLQSSTDGIYLGKLFFKLLNAFFALSIPDSFLSLYSNDLSSYDFLTAEPF